VSFAYIASPYSPVGVHSEDERRRVRAERFDAACRATAVLMKRGVVAFSPIAHSHSIEQHFEGAESGEFWKRQDEPYLTACDRLIVLTLPDWGLSAGVAHEIAVAAARGIPIEYLSPEAL
jgi:hypothetical protein